MVTQGFLAPFLISFLQVFLCFFELVLFLQVQVGSSIIEIQFKMYFVSILSHMFLDLVMKRSCPRLKDL